MRRPSHTSFATTSAAGTTSTTSITSTTSTIRADSATSTTRRRCRRQSCHYATSLRLRLECHIQNLFEQLHNLSQFLYTSDAIWPVSGECEVLTYLGGVQSSQRPKHTVHVLRFGVTFA
jgi:hypothetical protein